MPKRKVNGLVVVVGELVLAASLTAILTGFAHKAADPSVAGLTLTPPPGLPTVVQTHGPRGDGLYEVAQAPFPNALYAFKNQWQGHLQENLMMVYAGRWGHETADPGRGVLVIDSRPIGDVTSLSAPLGIGYLHIVEFEGYVLTIQADTGEIFHLDAETHEFTDENGEPVPTDSPTPTYAPTTPGPTISPDPEENSPTPTQTSVPTPSLTPTSALPTQAAGG